MASDDSDDEPLSVLAATKRLCPENFEITKVKSSESNVRKKKKINLPKKLALTIKLCSNEAENKIVERPTDVWLYMKDLNPTGPYSCLMCSEWFINRIKLMVHYILNHKKDFCGICRYFVANREDWENHQLFHAPWLCSQCGISFETEPEMRGHLNSAHNLIHCLLCHFRVTGEEQYNIHLLKKHNVKSLTCQNNGEFWKHEYEGSPKFSCSLCSKPDLLSVNFFNHYMSYHHFTLKCFSSLVGGRDVPFTVEGADISSQFLDEELRNQAKLGYMDSDKKTESQESDNNDNSMIAALIPEIKQETVSDEEISVKAELNKIIKNDLLNSYNGDEDFDITLIEVIVLHKCYFDYIEYTLNLIKAKSIPEDSNIDYSLLKKDVLMEIFCCLCNVKFETVRGYSVHMGKKHSVKAVPTYSCRVCSRSFETQIELENHVREEMQDFEDLWMCQFCDKEFDNRQATRRHLNEHWDELEFDNCFSPHLGFKCKYCPTLFWNETDRISHQTKTHYNQYKESFYKCEICSDVFSDQVWFAHHYIEKHKKKDEVPGFLLKCCLCSLVLPSLEEMRRHFGTDHPEARKVFCSLGACQYKPLSQRKSFKVHLKVVHGSESPKSERCCCVMCGRDFPSARACGTHMAQVHGPGKFKCKLCREVMHTSDERKLHYLLRHPGRHPFSCNECGKSFQYKSSLYMHKQDHDPNKKSFTCTYCGKVFLKKDSFREHVQIHEGPRHACSYCPKRFVQRSNMLRHERRHTGERPYHCPHCGRAFADKGACTSHARTHTRDTSFPCLYCGQTFVQKSKLNYHIRKHTGENLETCTVCAKMFTSACSLREHMKTHEAKKGNMTVPCPLCDRTYQDEKYMLRHLRTIHTSTKFDCPICSKSLTSAAGLRHHVVTHSNVYLYRCKLCPKAYAVRRTLIKHLRRRHYLKGSNAIMKDFYHTLDPRDCNLGLDENVMNEIFGPPKVKPPEVLLRDFITLKNVAENHANDANVPSDDGTAEKSDEESDEEKNEDDEHDETEDQLVVELEPTDFVSVKIEPMDSYEIDE